MHVRRATKSTQAGANAHYYLRLLEVDHFERRARGGWRFGTKVTSDAVVGRLIASDHVEVIGDRLNLRNQDFNEYGI
jgi:hypothetical protein